MSGMNNNQSKAFIWNTINSGLNAGMSALLLMVVNRGFGESNAGVFALAFSIAQLMASIAYFEVRSYQVTDVNDKYSNSDYFMFRVLTCLTTIVVSVGYVVIKGYTFSECSLILWLCLLKMYDAVEDYYIAVYQKEGLLHIGTRRSSIRLIVSMGIFVVAIILGANMLVSTIVCVVISGLIVGYWFVVKENLRLHLSYKINLHAMKGICVECFSLFAGSYLLIYIGNAPKYAIDQFMEAQYQTYYGILYTLSFVINLFSGFVFKPLLGDMATYYYEDKKKYRNLILKMFAILTVISIGIIGTGWLIGIPVLNIVYAVDLTPYVIEFVIVLCGGAIAAFAMIVYYMLTIMRYQQWLILGYGITALAAGILSPIMVEKNGIMGASLAFLLFSVIRMAVFLITLLVAILCEKRKRKL